MNDKNNVYMLFVDTSSGIMKTIGMIDDDGVSVLKGEADRPVQVRFMRMLSSTQGGLGFSEVFPFASDRESFVMRGKVVSFAKASSTMSSVFTENISNSTRFSHERNIPHFSQEDIVPIDTTFQ